MSDRPDGGLNWADRGDEEIQAPRDVAIEDANGQRNDNDERQIAKEAVIKRGRGQPKKSAGKVDDALNELFDNETLKVSDGEDDENLTPEQKKANEEERKSMSKEIATLKKKIKDRESEIKKWSSYAKDKETECNQLKTSITMLSKKKDEECDLFRKDMVLLKRSKEEECSLLKGEIKELKQTNDHLVSDLADKSEELEKAKLLMDEKDGDYHDLLKEVVAKADKASTKIENKPKGLVIVDEITNVLVEKLTTDIEWEERTVNSLHMLKQDDLEGYDIVLCLTGAFALVNGATAAELVNDIRKLVDQVRPGTRVAITPLPPALAVTQTNIMNMRLKSLGNEVELIEWDYRTMPRHEQLKDDKLTQKCLDVMSDALKTITIPEVSPDRTCVSISIAKTQGKGGEEKSAPDDVKRIVMIPKDAIGRLIGKGGRNIRRVTEMYGVKLDVGYWMELKKDARDEAGKLRSKCEVLMDVVLIEGGETGNIGKAIEDIKNSISATGEPPEKRLRY